MNANLLRRVNWLWKHRHTHDGDTTQSQIEIIRTIVEEHDDDISASASGAYIHLSSVGQSIAAGGENVSWEFVDPLGRFAFDAPSFPATEIRIPRSGYYNVAPTVLEWESWDWVGGSVSIWRNDSKVWPSSEDEDSTWSASVRSKWHPDSSHAVWFDLGDTFRLFVDHGSGSAKVLRHAALTAYLVDRIGGVEESLASSPEWSLVFSASDWGVTHDETNFWTTNGFHDADPALFRRSDDGTIINSYTGFDDGPAGGGTYTRNGGIVVADGFLWGVGHEEAVHKVDLTTGAEVSKFPTVTTNIRDGRTGIGYNGTNLFVSEGSNHKRLEEYTLAGAHVQNHSWPTGRFVEDLTWDGTHWWITCRGTTQIIRATSAFSEVLAIEGPTSDNRGCHYKDGFLYVMSQTGGGLYRRAV